MMKKIVISALTVFVVIVLAACGRGGDGETKSVTTEPAGSSESSQSENVPDTPLYVRIRRTLYQDMGYVNSLITCGTMDGQITSSVSSSEVPSQDDQSNFGTGCEYQLEGDDTVVVLIGDKYEISPPISRQCPQVWHALSEKCTKPQAASFWSRMSKCPRAYSGDLLPITMDILVRILYRGLDFSYKERLSIEMR